MATKLDHVRSVFGEPLIYYLNRRRYDIRIRAETVREFLGKGTCDRILDIGCGDGSLSVPLLTERNRLTLVDLSARMLALARSKVPRELSENVEMFTEDFTTSRLHPQSYDLIICIGVLAHVENPATAIAKMVSLLKPGGNIILEFTDSCHFVECLIAFFHRVHGLVKPRKYPLNALSFTEVVQMLGSHGLEPVKTFRYCSPLPGMHRVLAQGTLYRIVRLIFGTSEGNRNTWLGNEYLFLLRMGGNAQNQDVSLQRIPRYAV